MRTITSVTSPSWLNSDHTAILCYVTFAELPGQTYPFQASSADPETHGKQLWADLNAGKYGAIAAYVAPTVTGVSRQQYLQIVTAGATIASTDTPDLNGTYATFGDDWQNMRDEAQYISTFGVFSGGVGTLVWKMPNATTISFTTPAQFQAVVRALGDYLTTLKRWIDGQIPDQPSSNLQIP